MRRTNADGSATPLTLPNHATLKGSTLRTICRQADIGREEFLTAFEDSSGLSDQGVRRRWLIP